MYIILHSWYIFVDHYNYYNKITFNKLFILYTYLRNNGKNVTYFLQPFIIPHITFMTLFQ